MRLYSLAAVGVVLAVMAPACACAVTETSPAAKKLEQALEQAGNLHLPLNRAYLYRQAAGVFTQKDRPEAVALLKRALSEIDAGEAAMRSQGTVDDHAARQFEMGRRSAVLQLLRLDAAEAMRSLIPPQTADSDMDLQRQVIERLAAKDLDVARDFSVRKLDFGVTPAVVAAYDVLRKHDAATGKSFGESIVSRLETIDPSQNAVTAEAAFTLLRLQRADGGGRDSKVNLNASLLDADSLRRLYGFIADAFLEAQDTQVLTLVEKPTPYMAAIQQYVPEKADELAKAIAATAAKSSAAQTADKADNKTDAQAPTQEEQKQIEAARAAIQARLAAQVRETSAHTKLLSARVGQTTSTQMERDNALFAVVEEANRSISLGRALAKDLEPEAFKNGELEFYSFGPLTSVVDEMSMVLQRYALDHPNVAEDAASRLDGPEVQTEVELQIAIWEMRGGGDRSFDDRRHAMRDETK